MVIIIPARLNSGRLPHKPMRTIDGTSIIEHTFTNTVKALCADRVIVAVDNVEVENHCRSFGAATVNTNGIEFNNGTERCAYIANQLGLGNSTAVINVQGDNWNVNPDAIDELATNLLHCHAPVKHSTMFCMHEELKFDQLHDPSVVKVVVDNKDYALFFTRLPVRQSHKHCGIYGYHVSFLNYYMSMPSLRLEKAEALEQMRVLDNGGNVYCPKLKTAQTAGQSINCPDDLAKAQGATNEKADKVLENEGR